MSRTLKNNIFPLVAGALLVITSVVTGVTVSSQNAALDAQEATLTALTDKASAARASTSDLETAISLKGSGADADRVAADTALIDTLLKRALTWDSDASYREARETTMRVYGLTEASVFMTSFLAPAPVNRDDEGNEYPYIDAAGLNSQISRATVKLLSVDAVDYSYMVLADVESTSTDGQGTSMNVATVFVTIDGDSKLAAITGFASTTRTLTSG